MNFREQYAAFKKLREKGMLKPTGDLFKQFGTASE